MDYIGGFGAFGGDYEDWCDAAASVWPGADRETLRGKCKNNPPPWLAPWTDAGKLLRGLPMNFSSSAAKVAEGAAAAVWQDVTVATSNQQPATSSGLPNAQPARPAVVTQQPAQTGPAWTVIPTTTAGKVGLSAGVLLAGAGIAAYFLLGKKRGGTALAGYSKQRRHRRSRRSRR